MESRKGGSGAPRRLNPGTEKQPGAMAATLWGLRVCFSVSLIHFSLLGCLVFLITGAPWVAASFLIYLESQVLVPNPPTK